jgi:hypothetical protein
MQIGVRVSGGLGAKGSWRMAERGRSSVAQDRIPLQ